MCLGILERSSVADEASGPEPATPAQRALTFTEDAMIRYADDCVLAREAAALKRSSVRRQPPKPAENAAEFNPYNETAVTPAKPYGQNW